MAFIAAMGPVQGALAQAYPSKPITMVVPYAPGGGADIVSRTISQRLSEGLGQQIIIDNRPGAGGNLGAALAAKAAPDGYTLMLGTNTHAANMSLYAKPPYDLARDFAAVSLLSSTPLVLIVHPSLPASSVKALVALARKKPGELNYSSGGNGSTPHLSAEMFKTAARVDVVHVPYKGVAQGLTDLVSGQVQLMFTSISAATPHIRSGRLRVLAVTGAKRSRAAPEVPTMIESGFRGFEVSIWNALFVPAKTPAA
ncbi:MAG: tripartite tricarboxylate transporter substrate binding protein, partial [Betaproteobacteria bacterium]|nr:tripartite tricarboxylate transporter substrate binding protein [Betaproteobacteria bacterium]